MSKWIVSIAILNFILLIIDGIVNGGVGINTTQIKTGIDADDTTLTVYSTDGYPSADTLLVGNEQIKYNGKNATQFLNLSRAYNGTTAEAHNSRARVYSSDAAMFNNAFGFNLISTAGSGASFNFVNSPVTFFTVSVPKMITWNYSYLQEGYGLYLRMFLVVVCIGFTIAFIISLAQSWGGMLQGKLG